MNQFGRAALLLVSIMIFLSMITIFWVDVSETQEQQLDVQLGDFISFTLPEPEGGGLYSQSVEGLNLLYNDILSALSVAENELDNNGVNESNSTSN